MVKNLDLSIGQKFNIKISQFLLITFRQVKKYFFFISNTLANTITFQSMRSTSITL